MRAQKYDLIVSIGSNCEVTWNLRNHFGLSDAYPFDWWITPHNALLKLLENRLGGLFEASNLYIPDDKSTVVDRYYNIMYHHDFSRDENHKIDINAIEPQLAHLKEKYRFLTNRFINNLSNKRVLLVRNRCGNAIDYLQGDFGDITPEMCMDAIDRLQVLLPNTRFSYFATNKDPQFDSFIHKGTPVFCDKITNYGDSQDYMISPRGWSEMFNRQNIVLRTPSRVRQALAKVFSIY